MRVSLFVFKYVVICAPSWRCNEAKVRKEAEIRKRYNQVPHLAQDTTWESNKNTINITKKSQEVSPIPAGDHKAAMNRRKSVRNTRHTKTQMIHKRCTALEPSIKNILLEGLNRFHGANITVSRRNQLSLPR